MHLFRIKIRVREGLQYKHLIRNGEMCMKTIFNKYTYNNRVASQKQLANKSIFLYRFSLFSLRSFRNLGPHLHTTPLAVVNSAKNRKHVLLSRLPISYYNVYRKLLRMQIICGYFYNLSALSGASSRHQSEASVDQFQVPLLRGPEFLAPTYLLSISVCYKKELGSSP
jgi:hypothetical protein